eukprot:UN10762
MNVKIESFLILKSIYFYFFTSSFNCFLNKLYIFVKHPLFCLEKLVIAPFFYTRITQSYFLSHTQLPINMNDTTIII